MTPQTALVNLLMRMDAQGGGAVFVTAEELAQWPPAAVAAMKLQKLLTAARPAISAECHGCELACVMPVHTVLRPGGVSTSFVVCNKRSDTAGGSRSDRRGGCMTFGRLERNPGAQPMSEINVTPLVDVINFQDGSFVVDAAWVQQMVDASPQADPRHTPSTAKREARKLDTQAVYATWQKAYRALQKKHLGKSDVWYSQQIAKTDKVRVRNPSTVKKHMKS